MVGIRNGNIVNPEPNCLKSDDSSNSAVDRLVMPKFEKFVHPSSTQIPTVSGYAKSGRFSFNRAAVKEYGLADKKHCDLYFDKEHQLIGFRFLDDASNGSVKVQNYNQNLSVAAQAFCTHHRLVLDDIKRHKISVDNGLLVIGA